MRAVRVSGGTIRNVRVHPASPCTRLLVEHGSANTRQGNFIRERGKASTENVFRTPPRVRQLGTMLKHLVARSRVLESGTGLPYGRYLKPSNRQRVVAEDHDHAFAILRAQS